MLRGILKAPNKAWGFALLYAIWCLNHTVIKSLGYITPHEYIFGDTPDLSVLQFEFWEKLLYLDPLSKFPKSREKIGRFLGITDYV